MKILEKLHGELLLGFGLRAAGAGSSFVLVWLVAQSFGAQVVGYYQIALSTALMASVAALQGLDVIIVRYASVALAENRLAEARDALIRAAKRLLMVAIPLAILIALGAGLAATEWLEEPGVAPYLQMLAPLVIGIPLIRLGAGFLRSNKRILVSQSLDGVGYTSFAAVVIGAAWLGGWNAWPKLVPLAYLLGVIAVTVFAVLKCRQIARNWGEGKADIAVTRGLSIAAFSFLGLFADWFGLMMLTGEEGAAAAGIYRVAFQVCMLFLIVNTSFAVMVGPHLAKAGAKSDVKAIRKTIRTAGGLGVAICSPLAVIVLIWPEFVLGLFGPEFPVGATALRVLAAGQLANVAFGPVGATLTMMHRENTVLWIEVAASAANVAAVLILLPTYGMLGIAIASTIAVVVRNLFAFVAVRIMLAKLPAVPAGEEPA